MAFGFFRRHQKAVIVIMVVLMVAFLLTSATLTSIMDLFSPSRNPAVGTLYGKKVTAREQHDILVTLDLLKRLPFDKVPADLTGMSGEHYQFLPSYYLLGMLEQNGQRAGDALTLLYREAVHAGVTVNEQEIIHAFWQLSPEHAIRPDATPSASVYRDFTQLLRVNEATLRRSMEIWLTVSKYFNANVPRVVPSVPELRWIFGDINDKLDLQIVQVFAEPVAQDPTGAEIKALFNEHRETTRGDYTKDNPFGLGYKVPNAAALQWLVIRDAYVAAASAPSTAQIEQEYRNNADTLYKGRELWQVREDIRAALTAKNSEAKIDQLTDSVATAVKSARASWDGTGNLYDKVVADMTGDARTLLERPVSINIQATPLSRALHLLAEKAQVDAIVYPTRTGMTTISDNVQVTLVATDAPLGELLDRVTAQVFNTPAATTEPSDEATDEPADTAPARTIRWCSLRGMDNVLFACNDDDLNTFPLKANQTPGPQALERIRVWPDLRLAYTAATEQSRSLVDEVRLAKPFTKPGEEPATGALEVGQDGPMMYLLMSIGYGQNRPIGRMFWRLAAAQPTHSLTDEEFENDILTHQQVVHDWKMIRGFEQAKTRAELLADLAARDGLSAAAQATQNTVEPTGLFGRIEMAPYTGQARMASIPGVQMPAVMATELHQRILDQAFALAPTGEPPYPAKGAVGIIEIQPGHVVVVAERAWFSPGTEGEFQAERARLATDYMQSTLRWSAAWFHYDEIVRRTGYEAAAVQPQRYRPQQPMDMDF